jgi:hypothetical protein
MVSACSSTAVADNTSNTSNTPLTPETFFQEQSNNRCRSIFSCPVTNSRFIDRANYGDEATCRVDGARYDARGTYPLRAAVRDGYMRFDSVAARECLNSVAMSPCNDAIVVPQCRRVFTGAVALGAPCYSREQCADDAWCDIITGLTCPGGVCRAAPAIGAQCTPTEECSMVGSSQGSAWCDVVQPGTGTRCIDHRTVATAMLGQNCGTSVVVGNVETVTTCQGELVCDRSPTPGGLVPRVGTCRALTAVGAPCQIGSSFCGGIDGLCVPTTAGSAVGTCQSILTQNTVGAPCDARHVCSPTRRLVCQMGRCQSAGMGTLGSPCLTDSSRFITCNQGLYCLLRTEGATPTCQPLIAEGAPCRTDEQCISGICEGFPKVCRPQRCT